MKIQINYIFIKKALLSLFVIIIGWSCKEKKENTGTYITDFQGKIKSQYNNDIDQTLIPLHKIVSENNIDSIKLHFKSARLAFKRLEPIMAFFNDAGYKSINRPNLPIIEENDNADKVIKPTGFQVMEEALFQEKPDTLEVKKQANNIVNTLKFEKVNNNLPGYKDYQFLWLFRQELVRVMSLGITGFDSPVIGFSMQENASAIKSLIVYLNIYENRFRSEKLYNSWIEVLHNAEISLSNHNNFDSFNRYVFIKDHLNPMLKLWKETILDWGITFPFKNKINYEANSFFSSNTFNVDRYAPKNSVKATPEIIALGKKLFNDNSLSKDKVMSCATCHKSDLAFTDGLKKSIDNKGNPVLRNAPTLLYSGLQAAQFYDSRISTLEEQISDVVKNDKEFHNHMDNITENVKNSKEYDSIFNRNFEKGINSKTIRNAIAIYIRSLVPFNSKFDKNISGEENSLTNQEISGFNLFMGKAACATCHFAPVFNGTVPPTFVESEMEAIGTPEKNDTINAKISNDLGRYYVYNTPQKKHFFKTPTIRNVNRTAPYMHNGVYNTLQEVLDFYNRGGGAGIGMKIDHQTLPPDALELTDQEINDIIAFMNSLEDDLTY
ncbi:cytochrome-c peroxidase [Aquimarina algicola]|uniref:C-type cytochrome n=1 Tax=Aquimarina algicola TaxID=2589995 RepID=A0A504JK19_9FLAO|nr:cytochrome c peroxidase [Aquimarina algicola]TPN88695.1 c-type cytochrome [Aquimarina algicola]